MKLFYLAGPFIWSLASASLSPSPSTTGSSISTPSGNVQITKNEQCACRKLTQSFGRSVILPGQKNYTQQTVDDYWDIRAVLSPACVFVPDTADAVASALQILSACNAQFAVRGGGHMNYPGSNNIDGGVLVALSGLDSYQVHNDTIDVGPGLTWYDVYKALAPYRRAAIGGRLKTIGVPGLALIGGFHYFNNKYGYAMDNVVSYDVVLGNGTQVVASNVSHPDLFWALKGGANNYGIVTKFTLNTFDLPQITTSIQVFNETYFPSFFEAMCHSASVDEKDPIAAGMIATVAYNATTKVASASLLGVQEGVSNPPSQFANFTKIPATRRINNVTTLSQWAETLDSPKQMFRVMFSHKTMKPDPGMLYSIYKAWKAAVDDISDVEGLYPTFVLNEITPSSLRVAQTNGVGNVWGLEPEPLMIWQFSTGWANAQDDLRVEAWARQLTEHLHSINREKGLASEFIYMGDAGEWQDPYAGFPYENVQRMRDIRAAYDHKGIFSTLSWGGFKLGL
ncbi:putative FAD-binding oxidoreductase [Aspergillus flavus]|uniref:FAD-binding oxidoreductase n=1 Tax=Aspergillus flavus (strain ATCC 200026 / FGSC A1120 / IAM 13836 / NRRL 3357 / JCM 12722 / SRRC 167) TaxID=332952 RepID=A0A7U2MPI0_ASPFN|nr:uncharacterized protein G4B84_001551 [Aspergillus flavus NRRL3357]KAF7627996.1 hypothetical protein AFLA_003363 [Aspergillus flavus NRRL3357]QMW26306.1 hypothetical protein G4B84_001551 [Aspergillus flavus NRRL3357]QRD87602.1 putative FAD-binding oxidoreductase [Aspergillus flavus]